MAVSYLVRVKEFDKAESSVKPFLQATLPSLKADLDPGGYLEDLGVKLEVLGVMVSLR